MGIRARWPSSGLLTKLSTTLAILLGAGLGASSDAAAATVSWQAPTEIATGRGEKGPWQQNDSRYDYVDDPSVAIDERGNFAVAWVEQGRKDVLFQRIGSDGKTRLGPPLNVSRSPATFSWLPRVVIAPDAPQKVFILWQEIIFSGASHGGEMFIARSEDGGASFEEPVNISRSFGGDGKGRINKDVWHNGSYDLVVGPRGAVYAVWTEYDGPLWFSRSEDGGKTFSRPRQLAGGGTAKPVRGPSLALDGNGDLYLAWTTGEDASADIRVARSSNGGDSFNEPVVVSPGKGYSDAPKIAADKSGAVHLVFAESSGGPFDDYHVRHTRSTDGARTFGASREISSPLPKETPGAAFPALALDDAGTLYVSWELMQDRRSRPYGLGFTVSTDGGLTFNAMQSIPGSADPERGGNGSYQGLLMKKLAVNNAGAIAVVNSSFKENVRSRVWLLSGRLTK